MRITRSLWVFGFATFVMTLVGSAPADTTYWQADPAAPANWFDAGNWTAGLPTSSFNAYIDNGGTASIASGTANVHSLTVADGATGNLLQTGGTTNLTGLSIGRQAGSTGVLDLKGGNLNVANSGPYVGRGGTGTVNHTAGKLTTTTNYSMVIGSEATGVGNYNLSGSGQLVATNLYIGVYGLGQLTETAGAVTAASLTLGEQSSGLGIVQLNGGTFTVTGDELIGKYGTGQFNQAGGTHNAGYLTVSTGSGYTLTGGTLRVNKGGQLLGTMDFTNSLGRIYHTGRNLSRSPLKLEGGSDRCPQPIQRPWRSQRLGPRPPSMRSSPDSPSPA